MAGEPGSNNAWIGLGHLLPGATRLTAESGVNETYRGIVEIGGRRPTAYIKFLPPRQLVNELLGSTLARMVGLKSPKAFLVQVLRDEYLASPFASSIGEPTFVAFASEAIDGPPIARSIDVKSPDAIRELWRVWKDWSVTACFDCWIANKDRHWKNLLMAGKGDVWLIDHSHAFTGPNWLKESLLADAPCGNKLCAYAKANVPDSDRNAARAVIHEAQIRFVKTDSSTAIAGSKVDPYLTGEETTALAAFVTARAKKAAKVTAEQLGIPELNLENAS